MNLDNRNSIIGSFLDSPRAIKRLVSLSYDSVVLFLSVVLALDISLADYKFVELESYSHYLVTIIGSLLIFAKIGFYRAILRYMGLKAVFTIALGIALSTLIFTASCLFFEASFNSIGILLYWSFSLVSIGGARLLTIAYIRSKLSLSHKVVAIYGAGDAGRQLARAISQSNQYKIAVYIDVYIAAQSIH